MNKAIKQFGAWMESMHSQDPVLFDKLQVKYRELFESSEDVVQVAKDKVEPVDTNIVDDVDSDAELADAELDLDSVESELENMIANEL